MPTQQLEAEVLPFPESTITFFWYKYFKRYRHFNKEQLQDMSLTMFFFSENDTSYSSCCKGMLK